MHSPGESLKQEREARGKTIDEMAEATGIRPHFLAALEQEAFDTLPGRGFGKLYIRAYAEVLGFDPRPVIEAYDRAVRSRPAEAPPPVPASAPHPVKDVIARWRLQRMTARAKATYSEEPEAALIEEPGPLEEAQPEAGTAPEIIEGAVEKELEPVAVDQETAPEVMEERTDPAEGHIEEAPAPRLPVEAVSPSRPGRSRWWLVASLTLLVSLLLTAYLLFMRPMPGAPPVAARHEPVPGKAIALPPSLPPPPQAAEAPRTPPRTQTPVREQTAPSSLVVAESGVGLRLVGKRLEGDGDRFRSGQRVTFVTRALGGGAGESIRHVWLRDGKVEQSIPLRLGGASWRTYSTKTLGRPGAWAVEARDEQGRVLARADLTVVP